MKKLFILTLLILSGVVSNGVSALSVYDSSKCGDNIRWELNKNTNVLTLTGSGPMYNYSISSSPWYEYRNYIKTIIMSEKITSIGDDAFYGASVSHIDFPDSLKTIGSYAFRYCSLTSLVLPEKLDSIKNHAFAENNHLTQVTIPKSLKYINSAFYGCDDIQKVVIHDLKSWCEIEFVGRDANPLRYGASLFIYDKELTEIEVPDGITKINDYAFATHKSLKRIVLPESVSEIGEEAFQACRQLTSIIIPKNVTKIGEHAFYNCSNLKRIVMMPTNPPYVSSSVSTVFNDGDIINVPFGVYKNNFYSIVNSYKNHTYWKKHIIQPLIIMDFSPTSCEVVIGSNTIADMITSCGLSGNELSEGNSFQYVGLEPDSRYTDIPFEYHTAETKDIIYNTFWTSSISIITKPSQPVSSTTAILLAETNMADAETSCGFEYKRNDAPDDMVGIKVFTPIANGIMAGRLNGLNENVYYKYRAFYQSAAGNMYYGDWQYIFTGDVAVEFDPILYTYAATAVTENSAVLKGYALAGSDDFTEQGFEYWAERRVLHTDNAHARVSAALGEHKTIQASGIKMQMALTDLDAGTIYKYRTYAKVGDQVCYGSEMTFTTLGEYTGSEDIEFIFNQSAPRATKFFRNGQVLILRGDKIYTVTGQEVK